MPKRARSNQFFRPFSPAARDLLEKAAVLESVRDGALIFTEGDPSETVYLVLSGRVELTKSSGGGRSAVLSVVEAGGYLGELGLFGGVNRSASARAVGAAEVARLPAAAVREALALEPGAVSLGLMSRIVGYLRSVDERYLAAVLNQEKLRLVGEMSSSIIHDFKNPLTMISTACHLVTETHADPGTARACRIILDQTERMVGLAVDLMEFSQGHPTVSLRPVKVADLFARFRELTEDYTDARKVRLELEPVEAVVEADEDRFLRVLQKLATNSVEAMAPGGGILRLSARREKGHVAFRVHDDGPGIPDAVRPWLFEPFVSHGKKAGAGLGLAIAKSVVEAHGGTISVEGSGGRGTTVLIRLPTR